MTSISIDLSKNTDPVITDCIKAVKNAADDLEIDFFVVGATAYPVILR